MPNSVLTRGINKDLEKEQEDIRSNKKDKTKISFTKAIKLSNNQLTDNTFSNQQQEEV